MPRLVVVVALASIASAASQTACDAGTLAYSTDGNPRANRGGFWTGWCPRDGPRRTGDDCLAPPNITEKLDFELDLPTYDVGAMDAAASPGGREPFRRNPWRPLGLASSNCSSVVDRAAADFSLWHAVLRRLARGDAKTLQVLALGGSLTAGRMPAKGNSHAANAPSACERATGFVPYSVNRDNRGCAFPARHEAWLRRAYPAVETTVTNWAIGAATSSAAVGRLGTQLSTSNFDVAFLNFADNDAAQRVTGHGFEMLLRLLLGRGVAAVVIEMGQPGEGVAAYATHAAACRQLGVPMLSWTAAAGKNVVQVGYGSAHRHPPWPAHQLIADWLAHEWRLEAGRALALSDEPAPPLSRGGRVAASEVICVGGTMFDANALGRPRFAGRPRRQVPHAELKLVRADGWRLAQDRPDKFGWLADEKSGVLTFGIQVPEEGRAVVGVGYLQSYDSGVGDAIAYLDGNKEDAVRLGGHAPRHSQTFYQRLCVAGGSPAFEACDAEEEPFRVGAQKAVAVERVAFAAAPSRVAPTRKGTVSFELVSGARFAVRYVTAC